MAHVDIVKHVDISRHVRYLWFIRWMDYGLIYASMQVLLGSAVDAFFTGLDLVHVVMAALAGWFFHVGLRNVGTAASRKWKSYVIVLCAALPSCLLLGVGGLVDEGPRGPVAAAYFLFGALWIVATLYAVARVRRLRIPGADTNLRELGKTMADDGRASSAAIDLSRVKRVSMVAGIALGALGAAVLIGSAVGHYFASEHARNLNDVRQQANLFLAIDGIGFFLLLTMRRFLQIDADALLQVDKRPPILFLRSFEDEEKVDYAASDAALIDYSLETRLSRHFAHFGPFVAVGAPDEALPVPGAARAVMSNAEWQGNVRRWMREAQIILVYCGRTYSVNWEMSMLARKDYLTKTIMLFPPRRGWGKRSRKLRDDLHRRLLLVKRAVQGTSWAAAAEALEPAADIRALVFNANGTLTVVHSRREDREAFHLAALVCHYLLSKTGARKVFRLRALSNPGRSWPVRGGMVSIGAARQNIVVIDDDEYVSGEHARIECSGSRMTLVDLQSHNGTFVNDELLRGAARLVHPGDRIRFGHSLFEVSFE